MSLHRRRVHPEFVDDCFGCRVSTLQFAAGSTNDEQVRQRQFQERFAAEFHNGDRESYKALRAQGLQPPRIAGSRQLEALASTKYEVETGEIARDPKLLKQALQVATDGGFNPLQPQTTPKESEC